MSLGVLMIYCNCENNLEMGVNVKKKKYFRSVLEYLTYKLVGCAVTMA